ncbi:MAG: hypothetical protein EHM91_05970, partial [Planctomycetota bacterium]
MGGHRKQPPPVEVHRRRHGGPARPDGGGDRPGGRARAGRGRRRRDRPAPLVPALAHRRVPGRPHHAVDRGRPEDRARR